MHLAVSDEVLARRREAMNAREKAWEPVDRERVVSLALQAYAALATSADRGRCGIFRSSSRSVEGLGFEKTAPLWRRFVRFVGRPSGGRRGCSRPRLRSGAFAPDFPRRAPSSSSLPPAAAAFGFPRAHRGCSQPRRPPEGLRVSMDVALLEPWSGAGFASPAETGRAGGQFLHTWWLASWGCWLWRGVPCLAVSVGVCCVACCSPFMRIAVRTLLSQSRLPIHIQWRHILMRREARQHFLRQFLDGFGGGAA